MQTELAVPLMIISVCLQVMKALVSYNGVNKFVGYNDPASLLEMAQKAFNVTHPSAFEYHDVKYGVNIRVEGSDIPPGVRLMLVRDESMSCVDDPSNL